jgi:hypothetical protein
VLAEYPHFRSVPFPSELLERRGVLRQQLEHPVHPVDVVPGRDDRETAVPDPPRVLLQAVDDQSKIIASDFESVDAAEIVKVAKRKGNGWVTGLRVEVVEELTLGHDASTYR